MTRSTTSPDKPANRIRKLGAGLAVAAFWLLVWEAAYRLVAQEILLVSPVQTVMRLFSLARENAFWLAVAMSCLRVLASFLLALSAGTLLAVACVRFRALEALVRPLMGVIKATPVASFIILALVWLATGNVPVFAAFLMVTPMIWGNLLAGIGSADPSLLEMAKVFRLSRGKILRYVYLPAVLPHLVSACSAGLGFAWKSSVAAEVIALPKLSVGRQLYQAKIYLEMPDLFAWTAAIILLSLLIEKIAMRMLRLLAGRLGGAKQGGGGDASAA